MRKIVELPVSVSFLCLALFLWSGGATKIFAENQDVEIVKKDLCEINDYAAARGYDVWAKPTPKGVPVMQSDEHTNVERFINMKRARNVEVWQRAAEQGVPEGQILLGIRYFRGMGVPADEAVGVDWLQKAAEQGYADAQYSLGRCYAEGIGVPQDDEEAEKWFGKVVEQFREKAEQGDAEAQIKLGEHYLKGIGVPKDDAVGASWIEKAAEQGNADAQVKFGLCYLTGLGVPKDAEEAKKWLRKAEEQGQKGAAALLQRMEEARIAEEKRMAEEKRAADEQRLADEQRIATEKRLAEERRAAEEAAAKKAAEEAAAKKAAEEQRLAEEKRLAEEQKREEEKRTAWEQKFVLAGAVYLTEELQKRGFVKEGSYLRALTQYGNDGLRKKLEEALRNFDRADEFDKPAVQKRINALREEIRVALDEIARKTFLTDCGFATRDVSVSGNEGSCTIVSGMPDFNLREVPGASSYSISFPMPGIILSSKKQVGYALLLNCQMCLFIRGSTDRIQDIVRNSDNYLARIRFTNLREKWNGQDGPFAEILKIEIVDKAKERAAYRKFELEGAFDNAPSDDRGGEKVGGVSDNAPSDGNVDGLDSSEQLGRLLRKPTSSGTPSDEETGAMFDAELLTEQYPAVDESVRSNTPPQTAARPPQPVQATRGVQPIFVPQSTLPRPPSRSSQPTPSFQPPRPSVGTGGRIQINLGPKGLEITGPR